MIACRVQYSLKLAFALTVHRAKGKEFARVEIDCYYFYASGQVSMAVGRVLKASGLKKITIPVVRPALNTLKTCTNILLMKPGTKGLYVLLY